MKKVLVISPSGEVYDHDCVRWYSHLSFAKAPEHYHNIGDAFVFDSSLKLMNYAECKAMNVSDPTEADIERYNTEYDFAFLRGSNYLHPTIDWRNTANVLERLRIPIVAWGIGAQAPAKGALELTPDTKRLLAIIAERSVSLGVRGTYTADVLWREGIRNIRIVGCPTVFRNNDPNLRIELPPLKSVRRVAFTLRREVGHDYSPDVRRYLDLQRDTILDLSSRFDMDVLAQGEVEEKKVLWGNPAQREEGFAALRQQGWLRGEDDPLEAIYRKKLFYSDSVARFEQCLSGMDLALGYRLHGNLLALANRVPSIYFTYDSRTAEFAETFQIPSFDVYAGKPFCLEDYWDQELFDRFNRAYFQRYREMRLFLDENGVSHRMVDETAQHSPAAVRPAQAFGRAA